MRLLAVALAWMAFASGFQQPPRFLAPQDQSLVSPGPLRILAQGSGPLRLLRDGEVVPLTSPAAGVYFAELSLSPGRHELQLEAETGVARIQLFAGEDHPFWKRFRPHPPAASCELCHALQKNSWTLKRPGVPALCFHCHARGRFPLTHTHNTDLLADCALCHAPHGSAAVAFLTKPKETVCKQCHS
ncbi:MAG: hypothetical protein NZV14_07280 [Bryobacteraceae bacterium]|nr:hypothetical protein [Bryobacteraceae bacterium]MDW8377946.1 cytochrome c3 family protein [Bryobacterales bacterium]